MNKHFKDVKPIKTEEKKIVTFKKEDSYKELPTKAEKDELRVTKAMVMSRTHGNGNQLILGQQKDLIDFLKDNVDLFL
jgi:hypothetical protein